jgi:hypothetical protein
MATNIGQLNTSQTFENWLTKTNQLVTVLASNVLTAGVGGQTTEGDATLIGDFTATNLSASTLLGADTIGAITGGGTINFNSPIQINGASATTATFLYTGTGGQTRYSDGSLSWDVGLENSSPGNFIIDTGAGANKFQLSTAGTLTVPDAVITGSLTVGTLTIGEGGGGLSTDDISEGSTNLYYTDARVIASLSGGDGINITSGGVISFDGEGELDTYTGNKFIGTGGYVDDDNYAFLEGRTSGTQGYARISRYLNGDYVRLVDFAANLNVYSGVYTYGDQYHYTSSSGGEKTYHHDVSANVSRYYQGGSNIKVEIDGNSGDAVFAGDVTSAGSFSDIRLKENIVPLEKGLATLEQIKTYEFNYKDRPEQTLPGVMAQEIEELVPEVVYNIEMEDDTYKAVRYPQLVPLLINAIKELSDKVNVLENKLNNESN